ncbi:MAG: diheme cytochrome c [Proteobacteria bacterium]|nr:diheme cytochrome c [Pseudomonadota bacterium]
MNPDRRLSILMAAGLYLLPMSAALADGIRAMPRSVPSAYTEECGSCHLAYAPGLLPAASWQRLMGGLDRHYGTDAAVDATTAQSIVGWLQAHAASGRRAADTSPDDRITRSAWFTRKHRKVDPAVWPLARVKSAANCAACHPRAEQGRFSDDELRTPAGLSDQQRRAWHD